MSAVFTNKPLSKTAVEVFGQLFITGPTWDGAIISKTGRDELFDAGLIARDNGWNFLNTEGVRLAAGWNLAELRKRYDKRWYNKARMS